MPSTIVRNFIIAASAALALLTATAPVAQADQGPNLVCVQEDRSGLGEYCIG